MQALYTPFDKFIEAVAEGHHNLGSDEFYIALTNTLPDVATDSVYDPGGAHPPPAADAGYPTGGISIGTNETPTQSGGVYTISPNGAPVVFLASGGSIGPFRYVIVFNKTSPTSLLVGYFDYLINITLPEAGTFVFNCPSGIATLGISA